MVEASYFETSLAAFRQRFPHIADRIQDAPTDIDIEVVRADGRPIDVKIGSGSLYAGDGRQYADEQITQYMKRPIRFGIGSPKTAGLGSAVGLEMLDHIQARLRADGRKSIAELPVAAPQFLIIFGIGLGLHLERLIRETKAKWVLMVEPLPGLLHHSLSAIDWAELFAEADRNGIEINISCESSPESMVSWIQAHVIGYGVGFIDGSYTFIHYPLWSLKDARTRLFETIDHSFIARGFFEDELTMMTNTVGNLLENRGHMINGSPIRQRREPVFIVGSGPSIDTSIETIKKYRDRAIVISCGTGLRVLFRNGITPDFHTEMENGEWVYDTAMLSAQFGDLKKIILLTTTTVHPSVPPLFGETFYFFRDSVSSTQLLMDKFTHVTGAGPTVANTALCIGSLLGFTEFYLFGVDCGVLPGKGHHSKDAIYSDVKEWQEAAKSYKYPIQVPANFGGDAYTDWVMDMSRALLSSVAVWRKLTVYNCSDGAMIDRAIAKLPDTVAVTSPVLDRQKIFRDLRVQLRAFGPGDLTADTQWEYLASEIERFCTDLESVVDEAVDAGGGMGELYSAILAFEKRIDAQSDYGRVFTIPIGSVRSLPRIGMFFIFRVAEEEMRAVMLGDFVEKYKILCRQMCDATAAMLREFGARLPKGEQKRLAS